MDLNQVTLEVGDFDAALAFYKLIGLKLIVLSAGRYARFETPSGSTTLSIHPAENPRIGNTVLYFEVEDVDRRYRELAERGVRFESVPADMNWRWREARFCDPSGNRFCLFHAGPDRRFPPWRIEEAAK